MDAVRLVDAIKSQIQIPLVADIHFDYRLALECVAAGIDKVRINPGNIGDKSRVRAVVKACKFKNIPIRIGAVSYTHLSDNLDRKKENQMDKSSLRYCGSLDDNDRRYLGIWGVPGSKYCGVDDFFGRQSQY